MRFNRRLIVASGVVTARSLCNDNAVKNAPKNLACYD